MSDTKNKKWCYLVNDDYEGNDISLHKLNDKIATCEKCLSSVINNQTKLNDTLETKINDLRQDLHATIINVDASIDTIKLALLQQQYRQQQQHDNIEDKLNRLIESSR